MQDSKYRLLLPRKPRNESEWVVEHFANPRKLSPGTIMPPYRFTSKQFDAITRYMMSL